MNRQPHHPTWRLSPYMDAPVLSTRRRDRAAAERGLNVVEVIYPLGGNGKSVILQTQGQAKVLAEAPAGPDDKPGRVLGVFCGMALLGIIGYFGAWIPWMGSTSGDGPLLSEVRKATLRITVTERGNLESTVTVDGICEVNAQQIKIISLVPEGTKVKKGDPVCKFDSSVSSDETTSTMTTVPWGRSTLNISSNAR